MQRHGSDHEGQRTALHAWRSVIDPLLVAGCLCLIAVPGSGADVAAVRRRLDALGQTAKYTVDDAGRLTAIAIGDGSAVTADDVAAFAALPDLRRLQILDCRALDDALVAELTTAARLESLALTNALLTDASVEAIAKAYPDLVELDLSSNTNLSPAAIKWIAELGRLRRLTLMQTRLNDLGESRSLEAVFMQDFAITSAAGPHLAKLRTLESLEIFRCPGFGSAGVLALADLPLTRLTLRDLPDVGDDALAVLPRLPSLRRLTLHELASVGDRGAAQLAKARQIQSLDIWSLPTLTDATAEVIAKLPALEELSIRETGMTEAAALKFATLPGLQSLTFKNNGSLSPAAAARIKERRWKKLDLGSASDATP